MRIKYKTEHASDWSYATLAFAGGEDIDVANGVGRYFVSIQEVEGPEAVLCRAGTSFSFLAHRMNLDRELDGVVGTILLMDAFVEATDVPDSLSSQVSIIRADASQPAV